MHRPKPKLRFRLTQIINEEIEKFYVNEIFDVQFTDYEKILNIHTSHGFHQDVYRFKTNGGNSYDVEFFKDDVIFEYVELLNNETLPDIFNDGYTKSIIIGFTPTEVNDINVSNVDIGTLNDPYIKRTNRYEQFELLSKIIYLVQEYIKNNPNYYLYVILKNTFNENLNVYNSIFNKLFKTNFDVYESKDAYYYLKFK